MEEYPKCPRCEEIFPGKEDHIHVPKVIKCGHTICKECLEDLIQLSKDPYFLCPKCSTQIKIKKSIDKYPINKEIIEIIQNSFNPKKNNTLNLEGNENKSSSPEYIIVALGSINVGKTSLYKRLSQDFFSANTFTTVGVDCIGYKLKFRNQLYKLSLRDTAGQEKYRAIISSYVRKTDGVLFIFDLTNKKSFDDIKYWYDYYKNENQEVIGLLIGNKCDEEEKREVKKEDAIELAEELNLKYLETSAKLDKNIKNTIALILQEIVESKEKYKKTDTIKSFSSYDTISSVKTNISTSSKLTSSRHVRKKKCAC